jgi:hypothetical protein
MTRDVGRWLRAQWDRVLGAVLMAAGGLALLLGWLGARDALLETQQIPYVISGGLWGIFLLGVGGTLWLSADTRDEWRKLDRLEERLAASGQNGAQEEIDTDRDFVLDARQPV